MGRLGALLHLVLAVALTTMGLAQARALPGSGMLSPALHAQASGGHDHAARADDPLSHDTPVHDRNTCQTACCVTPGQAPLRESAATGVEFFQTIRYAVVAQPVSSWSHAPDPGIPKSSA